MKFGIHRSFRLTFRTLQPHILKHQSPRKILHHHSSSTHEQIYSPPYIFAQPFVIRKRTTKITRENLAKNVSYGKVRQNALEDLKEAADIDRPVCTACKTSQVAYQIAPGGQKYSKPCFTTELDHTERENMHTNVESTILKHHKHDLTGVFNDFLENPATPVNVPRYFKLYRSE